MLIANNPFDGTMLHQYPGLEQHQLNQQIKVAHQAFPAWKALSYAERGAVLRQVAANLRAMKDELADGTGNGQAGERRRARGGKSRCML